MCGLLPPVPYFQQRTPGHRPVHATAHRLLRPTLLICQPVQKNPIRQELFQRYPRAGSPSLVDYSHDAESALELRKRVDLRQQWPQNRVGH